MSVEGPDARPERRRPWEWLGLAALALLAVFYVATSWRRWTDPLIDFGRELYVPWRISNGALLYRDVDDFYGPLSQYLNAGLFRVFGPGLMILASANLAVFAAALAGLHATFRRAWGPAAALASSALFVSVFGFSQFFGGNHNFATPYAHEATHGFLVCVLMVPALFRWIERPTAPRAALAGLLFGLTLVLKPEIILAGGLVSAAAVAAGTRRSGLPTRAAAAAWAAAAAAPTLAFAAFFSLSMPVSDALGCAARAWTSVLGTTRFTGNVVQAGFLGFDRPLPNLLAHLGATLAAVLAIVSAALLARLLEKVRSAAARAAALASLAAAFGWVAWARTDWLEVGRCLLGLALLRAAAGLLAVLRQPAGRGGDLRPALRWLVSVLAAALMARMVLNGRIYQFGFYQAALAGILVPAVILGELPSLLRLGPWGRGALAALTLVPLGAGVARLTGRSQSLLRQKTYAVGTGLDRFYDMPPQVEATGALVDRVSRELGAVPKPSTLLVLPEGEMINYLARMPSPVAPFFFFSAATTGGREADLVDELGRHPPDWVVIVSRDLREYGIPRYGEAAGGGRKILRWVRENYAPADAVGGDPLDVHQRGAVILRRR
jgi:hypothetical protein